MITKETVLLNSQRIKNKIFSAVGECGIMYAKGRVRRSCRHLPDHLMGEANPEEL